MVWIPCLPELMTGGGRREPRGGRGAGTHAPAHVGKGRSGMSSLKEEGCLPHAIALCHTACCQACLLSLTWPTRLMAWALSCLQQLFIPPPGIFRTFWLASCAFQLADELSGRNADAVMFVGISLQFTAGTRALLARDRKPATSGGRGQTFVRCCISICRHVIP